MPKHVLIVGTGSIGERHLRCFQSLPGVEVAACEPNATLAATIAERYGCPVYPSLDEAQAAPAPFDAAVICTPAHTHIPIALRLFEAGLHLLIEKPLAVTEEGIDALRCAAKERSGQVIRIAYVQHCNLVLLKLRELMAEANLGLPKQITYLGGQHFPTFRPAYREIYYARHESGGGAIQDALTHSVNAVEWLAQSPIVALFAHADHQVLDGVEVEDTVNLTARLANKALASFSINQFQAPNEQTFTFHFEKGSLRSETHNRRVGIFRHGESDWTWHPVPTEERDSQFTRQAAMFLDAIDGKETPLATLEEGIQTLRVNIAALKSVRTRSEIVL
mgnify:CR=1 FL=1